MNEPMKFKCGGTTITLRGVTIMVYDRGGWCETIVFRSRRSAKKSYMEMISAHVRAA